MCPALQLLLAFLRFGVTRSVWQLFTRPWSTFLFIDSFQHRHSFHLGTGHRVDLMTGTRPLRYAVFEVWSIDDHRSGFGSIDFFF